MKNESNLNAKEDLHWTFFVEGVRCSKCIQKLESMTDELSILKEVRFAKGPSTLDVTVTDSRYSPEQLIQKIEDKGYRAYFITQKAELVEQRKKEDRAWLIRLAITFFFATNTMLFTASLYTGADNEWKPLFSYLSGLFYLPIFLYSAIPFYRNAYQSLKQKQFSADLAVAIAFVWGSVFSYINLFRGQEDFYFDSSATFIFMILLARFVLNKAQRSIETDLNPSLLFKKNPFYDLKREGRSLRLRFDQIQQNDEITVLQHQLVPVDGVLVSTNAEFDTSLFSGEVVPQLTQQNQDVKAGMVLSSDSAQLRAKTIFNESELFQLFEGVMKNRQVKTQAHTQAEIYSQRLLKTVTILSLMLLLFFGFYMGDWEQGFTRSLALFTIACPCALALAIPLASITALKRAVQLGIIAKTPLIFEKLKSIETVVFDKTGTLTEGHLEFEKFYPPNPTSETLSILLGLEENSHHPLAKSLTLKLMHEGVQPIHLEDRKETVGMGVSGNYNGDFYEIKRLQEDTPEAPISSGFSLYKNAELVLSLFFKDQIRPEASQVIQFLKRRNLKIQILSGDRTPVVIHVAEKLQIPREGVLGRLSPQEKSQKISQSRVLMVGDGHNDSLALSSAHASLAIRGSAETSLQAADAYSQHLGISGIPTLFLLSQFYHRLIRQNITLSLTYNFIAGSLAIFGFVNPLFAALLMPINSLVVITATALARPSTKQNFDKSIGFHLEFETPQNLRN